MIITIIHFFVTAVAMQTPQDDLRRLAGSIGGMSPMMKASSAEKRQALRSRASVKLDKLYEDASAVDNLHERAGALVAERLSGWLLHGACIRDFAAPVRKNDFSSNILNLVPFGMAAL